MFNHKDIHMPAKAVLNHKVTLEVFWPNFFGYMGGEYIFTGKEGIRKGDKCPSAEYARRGPKDEDIRLWLGLDGQVQTD